MAVQSWTSFEVGSTLLNDPELEIRSTRNQLLTASHDDHLENELNTILGDNSTDSSCDNDCDCENDNNNNHNPNTRHLNDNDVLGLDSIGMRPIRRKSSPNGLLQLSEHQFKNVLLDMRKPFQELEAVRPHSSKRHVGVFWDIQNCCISRPNQVGNVVQNIRNLYSDLDASEGEFAVVCDVFGVNKQILSTLNNLQANIFHVCSYSKNACDEKLKQLIYRFVALYDKNSIIVLISSDINFAPICSDLKYRQQVHVILVHSSQVSSSLIVAANECRSFESFRSSDQIQQPDSSSSSASNNKQLESLANADEVIVTISNWPSEYTLSDAKTVLTRVSQNVGGKVVWVNSRKRFGIVLFKSVADAQRCVQHVHNRKLRGSTLSAKILGSDL